MNLLDILPHYAGRKVLVTGHTGFKGSWMSFWLHQLNAQVTGLSLEPPSSPSLYSELELGKLIQDFRIDIRKISEVRKVFEKVQPDIVFHLAAQALVRESYSHPLDTLNTNILGTANILEVCRYIPSIRGVVIITSDKCYKNQEWLWGYRENEPMGGFDPYSVSKGCAELVTSSYVNSFFSPKEFGKKHHVAIASARGGNVIGGGDWATDRIIPDCIRALSKNEAVSIRSPHAIRPWQHVLELLNGYLLLGDQLLREGPEFSGGWNFAPLDRGDIWPVKKVVQKICELWEDGTYKIQAGIHPHEASMLSLDASKAYFKLGWRPRWNVEKSIEKTIQWYESWLRDRSAKSIQRICKRQIEDYLLDENETGEE
ncbi:CDP-glucose 4,6-dehydratase [Desulfobaculum bizertense]|uniref:CDP-glucose 4,6-dehydratase n=1 Tax=Desulfobaculum bizertense DSM 18034 TaxID=1121442 RepID=A0A1T4WYQ7_9BACT|nr:CDP-glucose 4,6-dehydratase [Desulfobaculum bizertense]SKA82444.1 CDP-glucose 4,6-dehydratase [Desulfobaculum bizertense DSM 18034]